MLLAGLEFLSNSIEKKSASLKVLVESNFERFVGAKATIDRVYTEMREQGKEPELPGRVQHSRGASRSSFSGRKLSVSAVPAPAPVEKRKNALIKESEYGVHGIKVPLTEVAVKAEEVWGPALNGREKEETLKAIQEAVDQHRGLFEVASALQDAIRRKDHETIVDEYKRARKYAEDARAIAEEASASRSPLPDDKLHQVIVTARMWAEVERQIEAFKRDAWKRLANTHFAKLQSGSDDTKSDQYMSIISIMLELGVEDNPIWIWLLSRYDHLKSRLNSTCERSRVELEILRRHLANAEKPSLRQQQKHLRAVPTSSNISVEPSKLDTPKIIEFWEHVYASMNTLLSNRGLLSELIEYWDIAQSFISGRAQRNLPTGYQNQSSVHHKLSNENKIELEQGTAELTNIIREHLTSFFSDPPIEDVSLLFSPLPTTPTPTTPRTPLSAALSPTTGSRFRFDPNNVPPPSPSRGESWEKYAFWPPHANALSGSHYLSRMLVLVGTAANELASLRLGETGTALRLDESLRLLLGGVRERCVQAVCAAWNTDAEKLKILEDWTRNPDRKDTTNLPQRFMAVQSFLLNNLQKTMYVEASSKTAVDVVVPPSNKLLQMVRSQFVTSLYRTLSGMVECAEKGRKAIGEDFEVRGDDITVDTRETEEDDWGKVDANNKVCFHLECFDPSKLTRIVHPSSLHAVQHGCLSERYQSATAVSFRDSLQRAAHGRVKSYPRCTFTARHPTLHFLHEASRHQDQHNDRKGCLQPCMGAKTTSRQRCGRQRPKSLRLHRATRPRHRPHRIIHNILPPHPPHPPLPLRIHHAISHRNLPLPTTIHHLPAPAHASHARRGIHGPNARQLHH
jgi:exocyst complex component 2